MSRILITDAQAWGEPTKVSLDTLDTFLLGQIETQVLARVGTVYDTSTWTTDANTPALVKSIISMLYMAWYYDRQYSEDVDSGSNYADELRTLAEGNLLGIVNGTITLVDVAVVTPAVGDAAFYPTDVSSAQEATSDDMSLGGPAFSMGQSWS